tara:strand:+ start:289 stop:606 length:318 start_codon:yes stop_codon:yes gene_type:complete
MLGLSRVSGKVVLICNLAVEFKWNNVVSELLCRMVLAKILPIGSNVRDEDSNGPIKVGGEVAMNVFTSRKSPCGQKARILGPRTGECQAAGGVGCISPNDDDVAK